MHNKRNLNLAGMYLTRTASKSLNVYVPFFTTPQIVNVDTLLLGKWDIWPAILWLGSGRRDLSRLALQTVSLHRTLPFAAQRLCCECGYLDRWGLNPGLF